MPAKPRVVGASAWGVEEEVDVALLERGALVDLDGEEERRLALVDALELVEVAGIPFGQAGKLVTELEQQLRA